MEVSRQNGSSTGHMQMREDLYYIIVTLTLLRARVCACVTNDQRRTTYVRVR